MAIFYVIGTPIGNLEDITLRALRVLKEVDVVLCEDTRVTHNLLKKYDIHTKTLSYHAQSGLAKVNEIMELIEDGKNLALVSDAGTPGVSDPGSVLVSKIVERFGDDVKIEAIPGPSALTAALSIAGAPVHEFNFLGFFPHKKGRETLFNEIFETDRAVVFYESPHRIMKTLESLAAHARTETKTIIVLRELTKIFEQAVRGSAREVADYFIKNDDKVRGEFVVIVAPAVARRTTDESDDQISEQE